ncbi:MAG: LexA family transcriptional regulator [Moraxella sp.]
MSYLVQNLEHLMKCNNLSANQLWHKTGVSQPTTSRILNGETSNPRDDVVKKYADYFGVSVMQLKYSDLTQLLEKPTIEQLRQKIKEIENKAKNKLSKTDMLSLTNPVPVINWIAAGSWTETNPATLNDVIEYLPRPIGLSEKGFCLIVRGESMMPEFKPDEIIYVEPNVDIGKLQNGDLVVVQESNNNEATFKQLVIGETSNDMYLRPLNKNWHEQRMIPKSDWTLIGKVVGKWVKY